MYFYQLDDLFARVTVFDQKIGENCNLIDCNQIFLIGSNYQST